MSDSKHTVRLHRVLAAPAERVYRAFIDGPAMAKWISPNGFTATVHSLDARVGGRYRMSFTNFTNMKSHSFGGEYLEMEPGKKLRYVDRFEDPNLKGEMQVTVHFREVMCGTELTIVQENIPAQIPVEMCYLGWQNSLSNLALLVEPEIKG